MSATTDWRTMDTAPLNGTRVLLWDGMHMRVGFGTYRGWWTDPAGYLMEPTHWQPLPKPPEVNDGKT